MANDYKQIWYFSSGGQSTASFTEVYYVQASSLADAATFNQGVITARLDLLHTSYSLRKIRISQVGSPRVSTVVTFNSPGTNDQGPTSFPASNGVAAVCTLSSKTGVGATRKVWLRGINGNAFFRNNDGNDIVSAAAQKFLRNWFIVMKKSNYEILKLSPISNFPNYPYNVTSVTPGTQAGTSVLALSGTVNAVTTPRIIVSRCSKKDAPGLNGQWQVLSAGNNSVTINYQTPQNQTITNVNGKLRPQAYLSGLILDPDSCAFSYLATRQTRDFFNNVAAARRTNKGLRLSQ